jgi:hypothetical protein
MRLLLDENASSRFRRFLIEAGHDVEVVGDVFGAGASDKMVAAYATRRIGCSQPRTRTIFAGTIAILRAIRGLIVIYPGPVQLDSSKLVAALENVARAYSNTPGLVLSLNEFF